MAVKNLEEKFQQVKKIIEAAQSFLIATHVEPDADALGSTLALKMALEKQGKKAVAFCADRVPDFLKFLPKTNEIKSQASLEKVSVIFGLDYGSFERLRLPNYRLEIDDSLKFITFDHHAIGKHLGLQVLDGNASSTAEIIYLFLNFLKVPLDRPIATCLLAGIFDDTGGFHHPNTSAQTLKIASQLMLAGAPLTKIAKLTTQSLLPQEISVWQKIFSRLEIDEKTGLIFSWLNYQNILETNVDFKRSEVVNLLSAAPEAKAALLLAEKNPGQIDGSLRSQKNRGVNVAKIAQRFGGGGHKLAAGFRTNKKMAEIISAINESLSQDSE
ncbi:MAG: DHHA1 domain-containing protein [Candidatus Portnoybacteria bacterium]|jgi:phosphoesterase RecJ-like protein|nr:DHHA1 domain-containing protein [Candidatus Portnoybacteria bacterium]